jgi:glycerol-3-phosphate acyltransferase PlsY
VITLVLDALKGAAAVVSAKLILGMPIFVAVGDAGPRLQPGAQSEAYRWIAAAAVAVILGHIFPAWLRFRGGKGVATGISVFLILAPIAVALAALVFIVVVILTRYVSLGSILAAISIPFFVLLQNAFIQPVEFLAPIMSASIAGAALIVFAHRENLARLMNGTESRFK